MQYQARPQPKVMIPENVIERSIIRSQALKRKKVEKIDG